jgi:ribosomal protein S18 acetylase RimI-like enzyme
MELKRITESEFQSYLVKSLKNYADELVASGIIEEKEALKEAETTFNRLLPNGLNTKENYLYHAYDQNKLVGFIWYALQNGDTAFIYDFYIEETMRRKGYGRKVMIACEEDAKEKGAKYIRLHVFGHNKAARALYESLNYVPTNIQMRKVL